MDMPIAIHHIEQCAPSAPTSIVQAIIRTESGFNPLAINVNQGMKLARQPASRKEAEAWARWLLAHGCSFDSGLMQINSANLEKLGLTPETVFDPCENIRAGGELFLENLSRATTAFGPGRTSLLAALSAYNTGNFNSGIRNGYVSRIAQNSGMVGVVEIEEVPPLIHSDKGKRGTKIHEKERGTDKERNGEIDPFTAPTGLDNFMTDDLKTWDVRSEPESAPDFGESEPGTGSRKELNSSGWWEQISIKSRRLFLTGLLAGFLLTACADQTRWC
jgi:type IV secretion system protein VirB1